MNDVIDFINMNRDRFVDELKEYLAIPSISALPAHVEDVRRLMNSNNLEHLDH